MFFSNGINVVTGVSNNGKSPVSLKDSNGTVQTVVADDAKIDEFIRQKNDIAKNGSKIGWSAFGVLTLGAGIIGALTGKFAFVEKMSKMEAALGNALIGTLGGIIGWAISDSCVLSKQSKLAQKFIQDNK